MLAKGPCYLQPTTTTKPPGEHQPVKGKPWYNRFRAACLPFVGTSSLILLTMMEKARMKTPISRKRPSVMR